MPGPIKKQHRSTTPPKYWPMQMKHLAMGAGVLGVAARAVRVKWGWRTRRKIDVNCRSAYSAGTRKSTKKTCLATHPLEYHLSNSLKASICAYVNRHM